MKVNAIKSIRCRVVMALCAFLFTMVGLAAELEFSDSKGWRISGAEEGTYVRVGGRLHIDAASFSDDLTRLSNDVIARRARISLGGRYRDDWRAAADYDFGELDGFKNLWVRYSGFENLNITLGNQIVPYSLEEQISSNNISFMERSLSNALSPGFLVGLAARKWGDNWSVTGGVFGDELDDRQKRKGDGTSVSGRVTYTPIRSGKGHLVHLGASAEFRNMKDDIVRFRTRPEAYATTVKLVDTGTITNASKLRTEGLEAAWRYRRFSLQAEYGRTHVSRPGDASLNFDTGYIALSYFLTNHRRGYRTSSGAFRKITRGAKNAWELVARASYVDLNDKDVLGGREENLTLGVNWYINQHYRLMFNYVDVDVDPNSSGLSESPSVIQARFQVVY